MQVNRPAAIPSYRTRNPEFLREVLPRLCYPEAAIFEPRRKQEHRKLSQAGTSPLVGSKWAWLRKYPDGRSAEAVSFRALNQLNLKTSRAWCIKENFSQFWSYSYKGAAKRFFKAWSNNAMRSRLEPVKKVVKMLRRHEEGLRNTHRRC